MAGDHRRAVALYQALLERFPDHPTARQRLVKALFAVGDSERVVASLDHRPVDALRDAESCTYAAICHFQRSQERRGEAFLERALAIDPTFVTAALLKAARLVANGRYAETVALLEPLPEGGSDDAEVHMTLGRALKGLGRDSDALPHFLTAARAPSLASLAAREAGLILHGSGRHREAVEHLQLAHQADPGNIALAERLIESLLAVRHGREVFPVVRAVLNGSEPDIAVWNGFAIHAKTAGDKELSVRILRAALLRDPANATLLYNAGITLNELSLAEEAETLLLRAVRLSPSYAKAWNALSVSLSIQFRFDESEAAARTSLRLKGDNRAAWLNLAVVLRAQARFVESVAAFRKALEIDAKYGEANYNLAYTLLMVGELQEGFRQYDWRFAMPDFPSPKRPYRQREWTGQDLADSGIVVYMEQGMGDEIMFSWYLHHLKGRAGRIVVECDHRLIALFERSFPDITFVPRTKAPDPRAVAPHITYKVPVGHLPKFFCIETREHIHRTCHVVGRPYVRGEPYLQVDPERRAHWAAWLKERAGGRPLVGTSWRSARHSRARDLQYLEPAEISRAFGSGVAVVNLQYSTADEELEEFGRLSAQHGFPFIHPEGIDLKDDLDDVMALIAALDLVITPLISVAWMAGALGVPTWVFRTSEVSRIWQQLGMPYVPWCPSMRLFFRHPLEPWKRPLATVRGEVEAWLASR